MKGEAAKKGKKTETAEGVKARAERRSGHGLKAERAVSERDRNPWLIEQPATGERS